MHLWLLKNPHSVTRHASSMHREKIWKCIGNRCVLKWRDRHRLASILCSIARFLFTLVHLCAGNFSFLTQIRVIQHLRIIWGQGCPRLEAGHYRPNGPITQPSPYLARKPCTVSTVILMPKSTYAYECLQMSVGNFFPFMGMSVMLRSPLHCACTELRLALHINLLHVFS